MTLYNVIMFLIVLVATVVGLFIYLKPDPLAGEIEEEEDKFSYEYLLTRVREEFNHYKKLNVAELDLNKAQSDKIERDKKQLNSALRTCYLGDLNSKRYVKEFIKQLLTGVLEVTEETINHPIPFDLEEELSIRNKFSILMYVYREKFGVNALGKMITTNHLDEPIGEGSNVRYCVTAGQMITTYSRHKRLVEALSFDDKVNILTQRIYEDYVGLSVIDEIRDMNVDGIQCGVSGIPYRESQSLDDWYWDEGGSLPNVSYNSVWVTFKGRPIHFAFLGFESESAFERVGKRVYKYDNPGTLSASKGYIVNDMADGSRVVVVRPGMAESWGFFIRKLDVASKMSIEELMPDRGNEKLIELVKWVILGCTNTIITGAQGTGKSTFMMSVIQFIRKTFTIRVQEMAFELNLRSIYPEKNVMSLRETDTVSGQDGLNVQKKMDGSCNLLGEVADQKTARWAIQICQTGSNMLLATHHAKTTPDLLKAFSDNTNDRDKLELAATSLNFDIHLNRSVDGHRYVERITAILPHVAEAYSDDLDEARKQYFFRQTDRQVFDVVDILRWEDGEYKFVGEIDDSNAKKIADNLAREEREEFLEFCNRIRREVGA